MKKNNIIFFVIVVIGILLRLIVIQGRDLFIDEVYYWMVSNVNSWRDLIFINHWIKDHGILYYLWLKILIHIIPDIPTLRYSNIVLYIISSVFLYINMKGKSNTVALMSVALFSFHRYFIFLSSTLTPYNLVACLAIISISGILYSGNKITRWMTIGSLACITAMAFYSDYSFYFALPFYIAFFIFKIGDNQTAREEKIAIGILYFLTFQLLIPGLIQFITNINSIERLFANRYFESSFVHYFYTLAGTIFFRAVPPIGIVGLIIPILLLIFSRERKNVVFIYSYIGSILLLFISQRYFFSLFAERYLWFLYLFYILLLTRMLEKRVYGAYYLVTVFIVCNVVNIIIPFTTSFRAPGDISYEVKYSSMLLNKANQDAKRIIVLDNTSASDVLTRYYFGSRYPSSDTYSKSIHKIKERVIILSSKTEDINVNLEKLIIENQKPCVLYYVTEKKERVAENSNVKRLGCETVYSLDNIYGYIDSFSLVYKKQSQ